MPGDDTFEPLSGASLGLAGDSASTAPSVAGLEVPERARYQDGGLLGRGGMGEVRAALDRRLGRTVAMKRPLRAGRRADSQLFDEAVQTARLAHPGIVPVHDVGRDEDGRAYYTMPVIRGRSLSEVASGATMAERLRLVRHFLDACQAVAYAHSEGLVNRDLKPANIMVGRFGETQVVDWGLAGPVGSRPVDASGQGVGTPGYMSPEQRRGEPLSPASDVFSLGCTLFQLLADRLPPGPGARLREFCPEAPADLATIVDRALAEDPGARYPDARALADDVAAWFEGRRVAAHTYSVGELAARAWTTWRIPFLVTVLALISAGAAIVVSFERATTERDRARAAEQAATEALGRSDLTLLRSQVAQALDAMEHDQRAEAEVLATTALTLVESLAARGIELEGPQSPAALARGVLMRFDPRARPRLSAALPAPDCLRRALSTSGARLACVSSEDVRVYDISSGLREIMVTPGTAQNVAFAGEDVLGLRREDGVLELLRVSDPEPSLLRAPGHFESRLRGGASEELYGWLSAWSIGLAQPATGEMFDPGVCRDSALPVVADVVLGREGKVVVVCQDGRVRVADRRGEHARDVLKLDTSEGPPVGIALDAHEEHIAAIGLAGGEVVAVDLRDGRVLTRTANIGGSTQDLAVAGGRLAVAGSTGITVWDLASGLVVASLPGAMCTIRWLDRGLRLRAVGSQVEDWVLPDTPPWPHRRSWTHGVGTVALSPDGLHLAVGLGDGLVSVSRLERREPLFELRGDDSVVKDVAFSPDARTLAALYASSSNVLLIDLQRPESPRAVPGGPGRRLSWLVDGRLVVGHYANELRVFGDPLRSAAWERVPLPGRVTDLEEEPGRAGLVLRDNMGNVWSFDQQLRSILETVSANAVAGDRDTLVYANKAAIVLRRGQTSRSVPLSGVVPVDIALAPGGGFFATGQLDGGVVLWDTETLSPLAALRGHTDRVSSLAFDATGEWLVSGGWDGSVRVWSTAPLYATPAELRDAATQAWGRDAAELTR